MKRILFLLIFLCAAARAWAAFPTVASVTESTADIADHIDVLMPATVNANELLLMFEANQLDATGGTVTPSGWTLIFEDDDGDNNRFHIFAKKAIGNEDGTTVTITYGDNNNFASAQVYRIQGWDGGTLANVIEAADTFSGVACDPPSLNPTNWGAEQTLWIEMATEDINDMTAASCSTNYTDGVKTHDDSRSQILTCRRNNNTAAEDPGTFGDVAAGRQFAVTVAVRHGTSGPACDPPVPDDTLQDGTVGYGWHGVITSTGGTSPYTYAVTSGSLPAGITLNSDGTLSGLPTAAATSNFTITATDSVACTAAVAYSVIMEAQVATTGMKTGWWENKTRRPLLEQQ